MSGKVIIGVLVAASLAINGWSLAQQERPPAKVPTQPESGPFVVSSAGQSAVLLDTKSGKTWILNHSVPGEPVWLPAKRIDSYEEAQVWQDYQKKVRERQAQQEKAKNK